MYRVGSPSLESDIILYRPVINNELISDIIMVKGKKKQGNALENLGTVANSLGFAGDIWQKYLLHEILLTNNTFSYMAARKMEIPNDLKLAIIEELKLLQELVGKDLSWPIAIRAWYKNYVPTGENNLGNKYQQEFTKLAADFWQLDAHEKYKNLVKYHNKMGSGILMPYQAFIYSDKLELEGIAQPDPIKLNDLIGYEKQKTTVQQNTNAFLENNIANHLLLYGQRGTGKSSMIKAIGNYYADEGLKLVELGREEINDLPNLLNILANEPWHFIIFIDDISFESHESSFKQFKTILEGSVSSLPDNVLIYATSNRRHLIKETWAERKAAHEDVNPQDAMAEKLALSDRFGITVVFEMPSQDEYLEIVDGIAKEEGLDMPQDKLHEKALQWSLWNNGRSGRTARQFINNLLGTK